MADEDTKHSISHSIIQCKSGIEPFVGRVAGEVKQPVEVFIASLESHFSAKGFADESQRLLEAKSHFNLSQGDIGEWSRSKYFKKCTTWEELKECLRVTYGSADSRDLVYDLKDLFRFQDRQGRTYISQSTRAGDALAEFSTKLKASPWTVRGSITVDNLEVLLHMAVGLAMLPDSLVRSFDHQFSPASTEKDIAEQIEKHRGKVPVFDESILREAPKAKSSGQVFSISDEKAEGKAITGDRQRGFRRTVRCFNCNKEGHIKANCLVKYCSFHKSSSHNWKSCQFSQGRFSGSDRSRSLNRGRSLGLGKSFSRGRNQGQGQEDLKVRPGSPSSSPRPNRPKENFHKADTKGGKS